MWFDLSFPLGLGFYLGEGNFYFFFIVFIVTSIVVLYRQVYMDHYNNKKFFFLTIAFFISIVILAGRSSGITFVLGWDGLGLSSLFLIMFYPGKIPLYNSFITFFFNRLGDCILILILAFFFYHLSTFFFFLCSPSFEVIIFFLLCCAFTKSAQFPLSSWLPAAMSAPTPISAIVHSSTLVTAGIYLIFNINFYLLSCPAL